MARGNLDDLAAFVAIAERGSFRAAAARLGVTPSALSHTMRQLEERIGVRLLHRTTRSVAPTDAGIRLLDRLRPAIEQIDGALEGLNQERERPYGRLRLYAGHVAAAVVITPIWGRFLATYPDVELEVRVDEATADIVTLGFDAGIAPPDRIAGNMVAVRVLEPMKVAIVASPAYLARRRAPRTPEDLAQHSCVLYRRSVNGELYPWMFERDGQEQRIPTDGRLVVNYPDMIVRAAVDGLGIAYTLEAMAEPFLKSGQLVRLLADCSPSFGGLFLYYPGHRQVPAALRALIDMIQATRNAEGNASVLENPFTVL